MVDIFITLFTRENTYIGKTLKKLKYGKIVLTNLEMIQTIISYIPANRKNNKMLTNLSIKRIVHSPIADFICFGLFCDVSSLVSTKTTKTDLRETHRNKA